MSNNKPGQNDDWKHDFKAALYNLLLPNNSDGTALFRFLLHWIERWNLRGVEPMEVVQEAVRRGLEKLDQRITPIENPVAWLRGVCLNILRDKVKEVTQQQNLIHQIEKVLGFEVELHSSTSRPNCPLAEAELLEQLELLEKACEDLSSDDRQIIYQRFYEGKTYSQIQKYFQDRDSLLISEAALRKRESRALSRLRAIFFKLYDDGVDAPT